MKQLGWSFAANNTEVTVCKKLCVPVNFFSSVKIDLLMSLLQIDT